MATTTNLNSLVINYLTQAQYDSAVSGGTIDANQLYLTPDSTSDEKVAQSTSTSNTNIPILFRNNKDASTDIGTADAARFVSTVTVQPSTGNLRATTFNGYTLAAACAKAVVTSIDTSASLPTSNAVKTFVEGKGYITSYVDEKIKLTTQSTSGSYPLLFGPTSITSNSTYQGYYNTGITVNPNTKTITATTFVGALTGTASGNLTSSSSLNAAKLTGTVPTSCLPVYTGGVS